MSTARSASACSVRPTRSSACPTACGERLDGREVRRRRGVQAEQQRTGAAGGGRARRPRTGPAPADDGAAGAHGLGDRQPGVERQPRPRRHGAAVVAGRALHDDVGAGALDDRGRAHPRQLEQQRQHRLGDLEPVARAGEGGQPLDEHPRRHGDAGRRRASEPSAGRPPLAG